MNQQDLFQSSPSTPTAQTLIVYHGDCPDGALAAWLARRALQAAGETVICEGALPAQVPKSAYRDDVRKVVFVDTCPKLADYEKLAATGREIAIYDHHLTAKVPGAVIDHSECGASLVAREMGAPESMQRLIDYVRDLDLWQNKLPNTFDVRMVIRARMRGIDDVALFAHEFATNYTQLLAQGQQLRIAQDARVRQLADQAVLQNLGTVEVMHVTCPDRDLCSEVANELAHRHNMIGAASRRTGHGLVYSLRSVQGTGADVSAIAEQFGGGGHRHAAGFAVS